MTDKAAWVSREILMRTDLKTRLPRYGKKEKSK
jgi:hypothetical protein